MLLQNPLLCAAVFSGTVLASPVEDFNQRRQVNAVNAYAPNNLAACPSGNLVRAANGVNPQEAAWVQQRLKKATPALQKWLKSTGANFPTLSAAQYPTLGLVDGGGGIRGFLMSAGVRKAFDANEGNAYSTSGLYQAMTYETGLSGSSASLGSWAFNNWPTTSSLATKLWVPTLGAGLLSPDEGNPAALADIASAVAAKAASGYVSGVVDVWGRMLSYISLLQPNAGLGQHYSDALTLSNYVAHNVPLPIMTSIGLNSPAEGCGLPGLDSPQYEFTPYEFGSWEKNIHTFMNTKYIGTKMLNGKPATANLTCTTGFDNVGWIMGTSTDTFNQNCAGVRDGINSLTSQKALNAIGTILKGVAGTANTPLYSVMPNPFFGLASAPEVSQQAELNLVDGGESLQVPPIWPLLYRDVDVLFISDNSADHPTNWPGPFRSYFYLPGGRQIRHTWEQAQTNGLAARLPFIPQQAQFMAKNLNKKTTFFGCNNAANSDTLAIVWLPNRIISYNTSIASQTLTFNQSAVQGIIANGVKVATQNGDAGFGTCLGCIVMKKAVARAGKQLPAACAKCFSSYCYN